MESCKKHSDRIPTKCLFCIIDELEKESEELKDMLAERIFSVDEGVK